MENRETFLLYTIRIWDFARWFRQQKFTKSPADLEAIERAREIFRLFKRDFSEDRGRKGPFMLCSVHRVVGDAVPWRQLNAYDAECLICVTDSRKNAAAKEKAENQRLDHTTGALGWAPGKADAAQTPDRKTSGGAKSDRECESKSHTGPDLY